MARRGRKRLKGVEREPNGKPSRRRADVVKRLAEVHDREEREALSVGLEARGRVHGINQEMVDNIPLKPGETKPSVASVARDQMAGSFIGRLTLQRNLTRTQYDAAMTWLDLNDQYQWAMGSPRSPGAVNLNSIRGAAANKENISAARRAVTRYEAALKAVMEKQIEVRGSGHLIGALQYLVVQDQPIEHLVGSLRYALNALAKHFGLEARKAA